MDWDKFDSQVDTNAINKQIEEAKKNDFSGQELPVGEYAVRLEKMELRATKDGRPMLSAMFRVTEGEFVRYCIFFNRVLYGTKNDGLMIHTANELLRSIEPFEDVEIEFNGYGDYEQVIKDVFSDSKGYIYTVQYDPDDFNSVVVKDMEEE